jgi:hypothetical protein
MHPTARANGEKTRGYLFCNLWQKYIDEVRHVCTATGFQRLSPFLRPYSFRSGAQSCAFVCDRKTAHLVWDA